jgi:hypothetical protein
MKRFAADCPKHCMKNPAVKLHPDDLIRDVPLFVLDPIAANSSANSA